MGRTGLQLSALSLGSWVTFHKQIEDNTADTLMGMAYDAGINFFDNAEGYAFGESEKMMGRVLQQKKWDRTSYTLSSKVFFFELIKRVNNKNDPQLSNIVGEINDRIIIPLFIPSLVLLASLLIVTNKEVINNNFL